MAPPRRLLMVAYHFPPLAGSSGIQRTLRLVQQLPEFGWEPLVLSARPFAYERTSDDLMSEIPPGTVVRRALALDTARHLSVAGRYLSRLALPDRWTSWRFDGVRAGMELIRRYRPQALWSTFPIATAHLIGSELQRRSGLPWIADFRDPIVQPEHPADPEMRRQHRKIEAQALRSARLALFATAGAAADCSARNPQTEARIDVLENGYDEAAFAAAERLAGTVSRDPQAPHVLLHSGIVYPDERDPSQLFAALRRLHAEGSIRPGRLLVRMRAAVHEDAIRSLAQQHGVADYLDLAPALNYVEALAEMLNAGALLLLQASNCNQQVPAKLYEYFRARRPILALTDAQGDTARVLRKAGVERTASLASATEIAALIRAHLATQGQGLLADPQQIERHSRRSRSRQLAAWLDSMISASPSADRPS